MNKFPTNKWLKPIEPLKIKDVNTKSLIMIAELINKGTLIAKVSTNGDYKRIKKINDSITKLSNMINVYYTFECNESEVNLINKYVKIDGFCMTSEKGKNIKVLIEVIDKYESSISKFINYLKLSDIESFLSQILLCQLNAFESIGFLHNDIHLGNILIKREPFNNIYSIDKQLYKLKGHNQLLLTDFDRSIIYEFNNELNLDHTLLTNILKTFYEFIKLLVDQDKLIFRKNIDDAINNYYNNIIESEKSLLISYYDNHIDYNRFIYDSIHKSISLINIIWFKTFNKYLFPFYELN